MSGATFVTIDSRDRERPRETTPGDYTVRLIETVRDVCSVKLRSADIPPMWNVPPGRSSLWVSAGGGPIAEAVMEASDHTEETLAAAAKAALEAATPLSWTVAVGDTGRLEFSASGPFSLRGGDGSHPDGYGPRSAGMVMGLAAGDAPSEAGNILKAPHRHQLDRPDTMYLHIDDFGAVTGASPGLHNCLEVINANGTEHEISAEKHFHPPLSRLSRLRVKIVDHYGVPVDFDNRQHRIDLMMSTRDSVARAGGGYMPE